MTAQGRQAALEAAADGVELPLAVVAVQLAHHDGGLNGEVLPQVVADQVGAGGAVLNVDIGVGYLTEILPAGLRVVDGDGKGDALHIGGHLGQVHNDLLVVAVALTGEVVPHVLHRARAMLEVAVENELLLGGAFSVSAHHKGGGIQVEGRAGIKDVHIPAQTHDDLGESWISLGQIHFLSLAQIDCHKLIPPFFIIFYC